LDKLSGPVNKFMGGARKRKAAMKTGQQKPVLKEANIRVK